MQTQASSVFRFSSLALRLGLCAAALAGSAVTANAAIVTFTTPLSVPASVDGLYINLLTGATGTTPATAPAGWDFDPYAVGTTAAFFWNQTPSTISTVNAGVVSGTVYVDLAVGSTISAASTFGQSAQTAASTAFQTVGTHILGFRFYNEATATPNYGYMTLQVGGAGGFPLTVTRWSFENTGAAITVVPEPATYAMFGLGALALGGLRLRQRSRKSAA